MSIRPGNWVDTVNQQLEQGGVPIGKDRFVEMRRRWSAAAGPIKPIEKPQMHDDYILDAIASTPGDILSPPVPLPAMMNCLLELWEDEGLFD